MKSLKKGVPLAVPDRSGGHLNGGADLIYLLFSTSAEIFSEQSLKSKEEFQ